MKYIGQILALLAALVCVLSFVTEDTSNTFLLIATFLLVAAVAVPCILNWVKSR